MSSFAPRSNLVLAPGSKLDRYEIICPIAEGGMGVCWLGRMTGKHGFERLVAIKVMRDEYATDPAFRTMFLDEARIASRIEHPNVAQILDIGEQDGHLFLVMEYVEGESILKMRRESTKRGVELPTGIFLRVLADALGGLHVAHELTDSQGELLGVVHRDVSPHNILVGIRGTAKLIDFGIAKARDRLAIATNAGTIKGKLHFMAPEQALGRPIDRRADIFSVGGILYFFLSGRYAYSGESQAQTVMALASGTPPAPLPKSVPAPIASIAMRALAHEPGVRFATAAELQEQLENAMAKTGHATSSSAVAAFLAEHLGDRAQARKSSIEQAIEALSHRRGGTELLIDVQVFPETELGPTGTRPGVGRPHGPGYGAPPAPPSAPPLNTSPGTLTTDTQVQIPMRASSWTIAAVGVVSASLVAIAAFVIAVRSGRRDSTTEPVSPAASVVASSTPPVLVVPPPPTSVETTSAAVAPPPAPPPASTSIAPPAAPSSPAKAQPIATATATSAPSPPSQPTATAAQIYTPVKKPPKDYGF